MLEERFQLIQIEHVKIKWKCRSTRDICYCVRLQIGRSISIRMLSICTRINWNMVIDATYKGNKSRYFNHSCNPNTEMQKWIIDGETRVGIFAIRYITKGEHLTYDYQFVQLGADQDCYCGAVGCRKMLGAKASKAKNIPSNEAVNLTACKGVSDLESPQG
ncbi:hypothetical protein F2Q69_00014593 [Brassica cretica]|uniref:SET domain-containing protein n=1 Tax=Brassica cretica TaxID=69181 RepID=A0A8S9R006_BRACR|nr:hypothetical protein F2Q69_00014593 [Brassica cretica]